jgi:hypothetical protein
MSQGGRASVHQHLHYLRRTFDFNTSNPDAPGRHFMGTLPAGAILWQAFLKVHTAFDAGDSNTIAIGTLSDEDAYADELDWDAAAQEGQVSITPQDVAQIAEPTDVYATYTLAGTAAAAGRATAILFYIPDNDL